MEFEPIIVGFLCNWCSYTGADLAGTARIKHRPNLRTIRVMCSGRVDPTFVLKAFAAGADGVLVCGCHPGDCHYIEGNYKTMRRMELLGQLVRAYGIDERRVRLEWVSASEGERFARLVDEMTLELRQLGPCKLRPTVAALANDFDGLSRAVTAQVAASGEVTHG
ncbi:MAG TPA: hydrogenase iron-sulfur subunit [Candidatus Krumholzibacteria bacterium]|nr:hydrogenase iron-sulfur subunit [Candidatus Krumholzibacteria bacterium]HPD70246.1 hydrogenase iron-sulfur subunit [Candidatus Krumholzibacteria bacterium]HRY40054.1 hydrogenase iron-sulfur subunit [Candidatus Krumholzibacteria bacterium]